MVSTALSWASHVDYIVCSKANQHLYLMGPYRRTRTRCKDMITFYKCPYPSGAWWNTHDLFGTLDYQLTRVTISRLSGGEHREWSTYPMCPMQKPSQ